MLISVAISFVKLLMTFPVVISGNSMMPTFSNDDIVYAEMFDARFDGVFGLGEIKRGDVVIFELPYESVKAKSGLMNFGDLYVKRVIGLPEDKVILKDGRVYVNGEVLNEPYVRKGATTKAEVTVYNVPADSYFLMGDNRETSIDSRRFVLPYVKRANIKGVFTYLKFP